MIEDKKRRPDVNVQIKSVETIKISNFDEDLWFPYATKVVDSERNNKRHNENEQVSGIETKVQ